MAQLEFCYYCEAFGKFDLDRTGNIQCPACELQMKRAGFRLLHPENFRTNEGEQMKYKVEKAKHIDDGKHVGVIVGTENRKTPYEYTDVLIETEAVKLKVGYPSIITPDSKLGKLFERLGFLVEVGLELDDDLLVGKKVSFVTITKGKYAEIVPESVKLEQEQKPVI